ncbi:MAG: mannose-6-phosphate isomerase, class I [Nocardioides sp.]|nr:mannose-6-phosphate isomerase, class I [Nocardioides sp.]
MFRLSNAVRDYAWGSKTQLAEFLGRPPSGRPEAELWIGAHAGDPSRLPDGRPLGEAIADAPQEMIGSRVSDIFGDRLPFLMKVLAVDEPLSLQVHPSTERARAGHARENDEGIPVGAPTRSYQDPWHKPELLFALTRFEGMAGFRDVPSTVELLRLLNLPWADDVAGRLEDGPAYQALEAVTTDLLALSGRGLARTLRDVGHAARHAEARGRRTDLRHRSSGRDQHLVNREAVRVFALLGGLAAKYPKDPGVLVALLLNHVVLAPGEAMFVNAGMIHAYTSGFGVEIMASSDNVLRAGLTPKHRDVAELLHVTNFTPIPPPRWQSIKRTHGFIHIQPPVAEFGLTVGRPPLPPLPASGPRIVLALDGTVEVATAGQRLTLARGEAVFVTHEDGPITVTGDGEVAVGSVPA